MCLPLPARTFLDSLTLSSSLEAPTLLRNSIAVLVLATSCTLSEAHTHKPFMCVCVGGGVGGLLEVVAYRR